MSVTKASTEASESQQAEDDRNAHWKSSRAKAFTIGSPVLDGWKVKAESSSGDAECSTMPPTAGLSEHRQFRRPGSGPEVAAVEPAHHLVFWFRRSRSDAAGRWQAADAEFGVGALEVQEVFEQRRVVPVEELGEEHVPWASQLPR